MKHLQTYKKIGFYIKKVFGDFNGIPFEIDSSIGIILIAFK